ncbi:type 1 protein phosphatase-activating protein YPI1 SCDLUD_000596 [Saccharomycodes ludwigii]|uniref:type 1 protein phosphatase-activating protein YPI1 n=1 Tax=Saccharomycodes ludwigii TaxID=36035 RepID=UPI001E89BB72|nr:hypothetical protein SCDLUD_000596 [Saccharomycodes ludwigii]KAH3902993.1 hypothetical protein SCDLUD_000596 [Saccharomycodes ludwigii]
MPSNNNSDNIKTTSEQNGSTTMTLTDSFSNVIHLRGSNNDTTKADQPQSNKNKTKANGKKKPQVRWKQDVVDNENMNKKKTKICCIFHPAEEPSDDEVEKEGDDKKEQDCNCNDNHYHSLDGHDHDDTGADSDSSSSGSDDEYDFDTRRQRRLERRIRELKQEQDEPYTPSNAYEIQPDYSHLRHLK